MENRGQRAKSYAEQAGAAMPEVCAFDYIAGAKEERILVCEQVVSWLADMVCEGVLETSNLPYAIARFKAYFKVEPTQKYYGDDDSRAE